MADPRSANCVHVQSCRNTCWMCRLAQATLSFHQPWNPPPLPTFWFPSTEIASNSATKLSIFSSSKWEKKYSAELKKYSAKDLHTAVKWDRHCLQCAAAPQLNIFLSFVIDVGHFLMASPSKEHYWCPSCPDCKSTIHACILQISLSNCNPVQIQNASVCVFWGSVFLFVFVGCFVFFFPPIKFQSFHQRWFFFVCLFLRCGFKGLNRM